MPIEIPSDPTEFGERLAAPIAAGNPVGDDPKYLPEYEAVKAEVAKTSERDWELVLENSFALLVGMAKDVTIFGYLMHAAAVRRGWAFAAATAKAYAELLALHWDTIHPQRERARMNAVRWLTEERVVVGFERIPAAVSDFQALRSLEEALGRLDAALREKNLESPPSTKVLARIVAEKAKSVEPPSEPTAPAASAPSAAPEPVAATMPASVAAAPSPAAMSKGDLAKEAQKNALQLIACDPESPLGYKLLRACRWQEVAVTPRNAQGVTSFAAPNPLRASSFESQSLQAAWGDILARSEAAFTEPGLQYWFDLQFYVVQALEGRGAGPCAEAVRSELKLLLLRVPQLADLKYSDGTPFANPRTAAWLEELCRQEAGPAARSAAVKEASLDEDLERASSLAASGKIAEALGLLQDGLPYGNLRERTLRQLAIAKLALLHGKVRLALVLGGELVERAVRTELKEWEPALASEIAEHQMKALGAAIDAKIGDQAHWQKDREELAARMAPTDPSLFSRIEF
jgi:type VI secretion system protein VasJ